jgi:deazaflavin-dependent oxidoreductase (nitroreductase family)
MSDHYKKPDAFTKNVMNKVVMAVTRTGLSVRGSRVLEVKGRKSGLPRRTPVNLLVLDGEEFLVAPRGETEWVRNARAAGNRVTLIKGRRHQDRTLTEIDGAQKVTVLRAYLKQWKWEVGQFFDGVGPDSTDDQIAAVAPKHPAFRITPAS